jgi:NAD(P)-dependent dehydrogenase (short-subunit alcohol dehydrogenase family)
VVFGGSRGIGAAACRRLASEGANVGLTYVSAPDKAADTVRAIEEEGGTGFARQTAQIQRRSATPSPKRWISLVASTSLPSTQASCVLAIFKPSA